MEQITEQELAFAELWHTPQCLLETLFHDFDNLGHFSEDKFGEVRLYQYTLYSDEAMIDFEATAELHNLTKKEAFQLRKNVGTIYCPGARKFGKTLIIEKLDLVVSMLTEPFIKAAFASVDLIHIREVLDDVKAAFQNHPICKLWEQRITGAPDYKFQLKNGYKLNSVNFNIGSKNPGRQWYGKHVNRVYIEEFSLETEEVAKKRKDALSELGAVFRVSGMCNFNTFSPAGKMVRAFENRKHIINLPQYVNPFWDEKEKKDRLEHYGGEDSVGYRVFVKGEVVEDSITAIDMARVRAACYLEKREIKRFEITKERYPFFRNTLIVERPSNAERIFISTDAGKNVMEILVHSEIEDKYYYIYNIVLYNLTVPEKQEILDFLIIKFQANVIGFDCGDGEGRAIYEHFAEKYPIDNLVWYEGARKIEVGFELDENKNIVIEKGEPVYRREYMSQFSVTKVKLCSMLVE
ncbi:hypothetical protein LCGC14_1653420, partial [marine sediment metagenome]